MIDDFFIKQYNKINTYKPIVPYHQTYQNKNNTYNSFEVSQKSLGFDDEYKWDSEAAAFVRWLLSKPDTNKKGKVFYSCKHTTVQAALDSVNLYNLKHIEFVNEQVDNAADIYEAFSVDNHYDVEGNLAELWEACILFLTKSIFNKDKTAIKLAEILDAWKWE